MNTQKQLLRDMRRLLASGKVEDRRAAQYILAQIGRKTKQVKRKAAKQQTKLF